jgi:5'-3' exoribonuclease 1
MGIPSYFSYIIRNHPKIISKFKTSKVDNFYLDSNSIIYDMAHTLKLSTYQNVYDYETALIKGVCEKILDYLNMVQPTNVLIAFDGVPPMAKMKQQKERRYKSWYVQSLLPPTNEWNTVHITPGTPFMKRLNVEIKDFFKVYEDEYTYFKISTSRECGEGEHKIFNFIRLFPDEHLGKTTMIYGLDSDLIVLSLKHLKYGSISLLREAPAFMVQEDGLHVLNVESLSSGILNIIGENKLDDYIFMTLLLGNDFMPHFPGLNIRTTGFDTLLSTYVKYIGTTEKLFDQRVQWSAVKKLIQGLAIVEESKIIKEYITRSRYNVDVSTPDKKINNMPMVNRSIETYILPTHPGWQQRYYQSFFKDSIDDICKNYIDMLEWNMMYYHDGCKNTKLYYHYMYPPLLEDLCQRIPEMTIQDTHLDYVLPDELLSYVLPKPYWHLLSLTMQQQKHLEPYIEPTLVWAYCKYIWESHVQFHSSDLNLLH